MGPKGLTFGLRGGSDSLTVELSSFQCALPCFTKEGPFISLLCYIWDEISQRKGRNCTAGYELLPAAFDSDQCVISLCRAVWLSWKITFPDCKTHADLPSGLKSSMRLFV